MGLLSRLFGRRATAPSTPSRAAAPATSAAPSTPSRAPAPRPSAPLASAPAAVPRPGPSRVEAPSEGAAPSRPGLIAFFTEDHRAIDAVWAEAESAPDLQGAVAATRRFDAALRRHIGWEEEVLFPTFENATGHHGFGPTEIMRGEHAQMKALLAEMERLGASGERDRMIEQGNTLMAMMQQHNAKEEGMLYPMTDQAIGDKGWEAIAGRFR